MLSRETPFRFNSVMFWYTTGEHLGLVFGQLVPVTRIHPHYLECTGHDAAFETSFTSCRSLSSLNRDTMPENHS